MNIAYGIKFSNDALFDKKEMDLSDEKWADSVFFVVVLKSYNWKDQEGLFVKHLEVKQLHYANIPNLF